MTKRKTVDKTGAILDSSRFYRLLSVPGLAILAILFLIPLLLVLGQAFIDNTGTFTPIYLVNALTSVYTLRILGFTLFQALVSTLVSVLIGLPGAYLLVNYRFAGKKTIRAICTIPFVLPSILVVLGFVIFYGNNGMINQMLMAVFKLDEPPLKILYSFKAIIMAHAFYNFPIAMGIVSSYWEHLPIQCDQVAATLGAHRATVFRSITLPRLMPAIASAATLIFLFCFSSFAILLVLGGGPRFTTLEVEIYRQARVALDNHMAAALSLLSITVMLVLIAFYSWIQRVLARQEEFQNTDTNRLPRHPRSLWVRFLVLCYALCTVIFVLGPIAGIIVRSFMAPATRGGNLSPTLKWYRQLFGVATQSGSILGVAGSAIVNSLVIAALTAGISLIVGTMTAASLRRSQGKTKTYLELLTMLPMAVSSVTIGLGYFLVTSFFTATKSFSYILVVLAHVVITLPFVLRSVLPEYRKIPFTYSQASLTLGATVPQTFWKIELPLLRGALATGAAFAFAISMGEINATLMLSDSHIITLPVIMYRLINSYNYSGACALGTLLIICCGLVFGLTEGLGRRRYA